MRTFFKLMGWAAALGATLYGVVLAIAYFTQERQIYFPPPASSVPFDVTFERPDGVALGGWVSPGTSGNALVLFGGNAQALAGWKARQGLAGCTNRTLVLVPYRGYEGNPGIPREALLIEDGKAVVAWAQQRHPHVAVLGISLGSGVATGVAADLGDGIDHLLLGTPYDSLANVGEDLMPWLFPRLLLKDSYDSAMRVGAVTAPTHVLRATDDTIIGAERTQALMESAPPGTIETVVEGGHETAWRTAAACYWLREATSQGDWVGGRSLERYTEVPFD